MKLVKGREDVADLTTIKGPSPGKSAAQDTVISNQETVKGSTHTEEVSWGPDKLRIPHCLTSDDHLTMSWGLSHHCSISRT